MPSLRIASLWGAIKTQLNTTRMGQINGGMNRIYYLTDDFGSPEGPETMAWSRVVVVPAVRAWAEIDTPGEIRTVGFLIRSEANDVRLAGYDVGTMLEASQDEAYARLHGWKPTGFTRFVVALPFYRWTPPQPVPMWDGERHLWFLSSEFRVDLAPPA